MIGDTVNLSSFVFNSNGIHHPFKKKKKETKKERKKCANDFSICKIKYFLWFLPKTRSWNPNKPLTIFHRPAKKKPDWRKIWLGSDSDFKVDNVQIERLQALANRVFLVTISPLAVRSAINMGDNCTSKPPTCGAVPRFTWDTWTHPATCLSLAGALLSCLC